MFRPAQRMVLFLLALGEILLVPWAASPEPFPRNITVAAAEYAPFASRTGPSAVSGFEWDLLRRFSTTEKVAVGYRFLPHFDSVLPSLEQGEADMAGGALHATAERKQRFLFSAYLRTGLVLVGRKGAPALPDESAVAGKSVGAKRGATGHVLATKWTARYPGVTVVSFPSTRESYDTLAAGKIDLLVDDYLHAKHLILHGAPCAILTRPLTEVGIGFAFRNDDQGKALKARIDRFLDTFLPTKEFRDLYEAYFF